MLSRAGPSCEESVMRMTGFPNFQALACTPGSIMVPAAPLRSDAPLSFLSHQSQSQDNRTAPVTLPSHLAVAAPLSLFRASSIGRGGTLYYHSNSSGANACCAENRGARIV